jgi:predicted metalloprotease with PDZ domain
MYRAPDFEMLADSPILAGNLGIEEFTVDGKVHQVVSAGEVGTWDATQAAQDLQKIVTEARRFWGFELPYRKYAFLLLFRPGGGGLEHKDSALVTSSPTMGGSPDAYRRWLGLMSHEYFHAFNVKRLRPVELGPFDFEHAPTTTSLWLSEGVTSYYGGLMVRRSRVGDDAAQLASLSSQIGQLQTSPGRLLQTLEQSSAEVWSNSLSGVNAAPTTVSYYGKGLIVGFLLDAHIRHVTDDQKSFDDVMRLAYKRFSGERGFTADEFRAAAETVAGVDLKEWFQKALASTEELDYAEALDWFGLSLSNEWKLDLRPEASPTARAHLRSWLGDR